MSANPWPPVWATALGEPLRRAGRLLTEPVPGALASATRYLLLMAFLAGAMQSIITSLWPSLFSKVFDDAALAILFLALIPRLRRVPLLHLGFIAVWVIATAIALLHSAVSFETSLLMFRQVLMPALLVLCGMVLTASEWKIVMVVGLAIALLNCAYIPFELSGVYLFDPAALISADPVHDRNTRDGLPGSYWYYFGTEPDSRFLRAGGLFLNPPVTGIALSTAFVVTATLRLPRAGKIILLSILGIGTILTFSRAGLLILVVGSTLPPLLRRLGTLRTGIVLGLVGLGAGAALLQHGASWRHLRGLGFGLYDAVVTPWGRGFGYVGNYGRSEGVAPAGESLLGIALSAGGLPVLLVLIVLLVIAIWALVKRPVFPLSALIIAAIFAAAMSESAGAVNGSMMLWIGCGVAIQSLPPGEVLAGLKSLWGALTTNRDQRLQKRSQVVTHVQA